MLALRCNGYFWICDQTSNFWSESIGFETGYFIHSASAERGRLTEKQQPNFFVKKLLTSAQLTIQYFFIATAAAPSFSTKETTNYARLCRLLVDVSAQILRETFDKRRPTGNLDAVLSSTPVHAVLRSLRHKRILNPSQWGKLYPALKSAVSSNSFDITLLMVLLRKICGLVPPATGWDTPPPEADTTLEADIVRIKCYINTVHSHASEASVDDPKFSQYWQDIQDAFLRLGGAGYQSAIDDLKKECMEPDLEEHYKELLKQWVMHEVSIKERLGEIGKSEVELKEAAVDPEEKAGDKGIVY